jgi:hypothetical protein
MFRPATPPKSSKMGCIVGCAVAFVLGVVIVIVLGVYLVDRSHDRDTVRRLCNDKCHRQLSVCGGSQRCRDRYDDCRNACGR